MSHSPRDNCYNTTAKQYRYSVLSDQFGGNANAEPVRVRAADEPSVGFGGGVYPNDTADREEAGGPANVDYWTVYCDLRDIRQQDYITTPKYPGRKIIISTVKRHGGVGQIEPFIVCSAYSLRDDSVATEPSPNEAI